MSADPIPLVPHDVLPVGRAAAAAGVSVAALEQLIDCGELPFVTGPDGFRYVARRDALAIRQRHEEQKVERRLRSR